jgi:L-ribulose-5-phosphate 4-epimerase
MAPSEARFSTPGVNKASVEAARAALDKGVATLANANILSASGHGNASVRLSHDPNLILLTKRSVLRGFTPDQTAVVSLDGAVIEGELAPETDEVVKMHTEVYRRRSDANAIFHTHSPYATTYAIAVQPLPLAYEALAYEGQVQTVPLAPYGKRGTPRSIETITETLAANPATLILLLANHGLLVFGRDADHAARLTVVVEEAARFELAARALGGGTPFPLEGWQAESTSQH